LFINFDSNNSGVSTGLLIGFDRNSTTGGTDALAISSTGNVGIGTTSPSEKLDVSGNITAENGYMVGGTTRGLRMVAARVDLNSTDCTLLNNYGASGTSRTGGGLCRVTFTDAFSTTPSCVASHDGSQNAYFATIAGVSTTVVDIQVRTSSGVIDQDFSMHCIGTD